MPTVKRFDRSRIEMYFGDHSPPHFHVITRNNERIAVVIETTAVLAGNADPRDTAEALDWARRNKADMRARWQMYSEEDGKESR
jgi:Domain of unknown function (DUF4160)